ncbi:MAG: hypothetical protein CMP51_02730 [Flavobacteriales bacterium]|nr:hypothetical protein [Flavobacteriales bacterium]|tara:strand:- start:431 stop:676 length:246 start_codon:yes stop_codon:yes gene_type:complete
MKKQNESFDKFALTKRSYFTIVGGIVLIIIGLLIMPGEASVDRSVFDKDMMFGSKLTLSVILIILGFIINLIAIFAQKKEI